MLLAPRLDLAVATLKIVRIRRQPSLVALPLTFHPARHILATLLDFPRPWIRFVVPAAIDTPLLSALCCSHLLILTDEVIERLMEAYQGIKRIKYIELA